MKVSVIIAAAGSGKRMKGEARSMPKQFWPFASSTILGTVLDELHTIPGLLEIIIACHPSYVSHCRKMLKEHQGIQRPVRIVRGGKERVDSVVNAFRAVSSRTTHILIHDAVRPLMICAAVTRMMKALGKADGIICARPVVPTIKEVSGKRIRRTIDRGALWEAETPQFFTKKALKKAITRCVSHKGKKSRVSFSDEASLVEQSGGIVKVWHYTQPNIKITTREDYCVAKKIKESPVVNIGIGYDIHRLVEGRVLIIGGVKLFHSRGSLAHSDGDVLYHALIDAFLGAAGLGDIGEHFPDTDPAYKNCDSSILLTKTLKMISDKGFAVRHIDAIVILERPKMRIIKPKIKKNIARIAGISEDHINIKAKTNEGVGDIGAGLAISAQTIVTLEKNA